MQNESFKHVTNRQGVQLAQKARENGVSREGWTEFLADQERLEKFFDAMKNNDNWFEKLQSEASKIGARVHLLKVRVDYTKTHNQSAMAGGPQTGSDYNVLKVANLYQQSENKVIEETVILFNWIKGGGSYPEAIEWGLKNGLLRTTPHVPFSIGEQFPDLNYKLGPNPMYVVETTGCSFDGLADACCVCWHDAKLKSSLYWQSPFGNGLDWFAFRKKISPKDLDILAS
jgi:hypothetical protein